MWHRHSASGRGWESSAVTFGFVVAVVTIRTVDQLALSEVLGGNRGRKGQILGHRNTTHSMIWKSSRESLKESLISCSHRSNVAEDQAQGLTVRATELWGQFKVQSPRDKGIISLPYLME